MKVYIAGKITGNDHYREEFAAAEEKLRVLGYIPINPAILPEGLDSRDYMRICLAMLDSADAIALLPTWAQSGGTKIELALAEYTGKRCRVMDCFNHSCPFRVNETSNANRCECVACQNRSNSDFIITSNRTLTADEVAMLTALRSGDKDYGVGMWC